MQTFEYTVRLTMPEQDILSHVKLGQSLEDIAKRNHMTQEQMMATILQKKDSFILDFDYSSVQPGDIKQITPLQSGNIHGYTVRLHNEQYDFDFYTYPEGSVRIILHRHDPNTGENLSNEFCAPSNIVNMDCTGQALTNLFRQIAQEYIEENHLDASTFTWHDFINIPVTFTKRYGVGIVDKPDIMCDITVEANRTVLDMLDRSDNT